MRRLVLGLALFVSSALAAPATADMVSKADWLEVMKTALPVAFCQDQGYFRTCFNLGAEECESTAQSATRVCLAQFEAKVPAMLNQPADGTAWGQKIGGCAGNTFEMTRAKQKVDSPKCNDPSAWQ
jgi:hypothetical protein